MWGREKKGTRCNRRGRFKKNRWRRVFPTTSKPVARGTRARRMRGAGSAPFPLDGEILQSLSRCHESLAKSVLSLADEREFARSWQGTVFYQAIPSAAHVISCRSLVTVAICKSNSIARIFHCHS